MPAADDRRRALGGRRPKTSKGGNRGKRIRERCGGRYGDLSAAGGRASGGPTVEAERSAVMRRGDGAIC